LIISQRVTEKVLRSIDGRALLVYTFFENFFKLITKALISSAGIRNAMDYDEDAGQNATGASGLDYDDVLDIDTLKQFTIPKRKKAKKGKTFFM